MTTIQECYICRKHRGEILVPGGVIYEDNLVYAGHASIPDEKESAYLGALLVEPKRHAPGLADLTDAEAQTIGLLVSHLSRALKSCTQAEHIYSFVLGHHVQHLHVWVIPRYPGAPPQYWGIHVDEWPEAPRGGPKEISALCQQLRTALDS
jgi:diadenosine tetraphosphate (Ap4A) HIT family hydrolase